MAIDVSNPYGGGMGINTTIGTGTAGAGSNPLNDLTRTFLQRALDAQSRRQQQQEEDRIRAQQASNKTGAQHNMDQYAEQMMRDQAMLSHQQAQPVPTKLISGPQIIPGQVVDTSKILMGNQPKNSQFSAGQSGAPLTAPGPSTDPGMSTGNGPQDDLVRRQQQLQISALANLQDRANNA